MLDVTDEEPTNGEIAVITRFKKNLNRTIIDIEQPQMEKTLEVEQKILA